MNPTFNRDHAHDTIPDHAGRSYFYEQAKRSPLRRDPITEERARDAGLLKTKYVFSLADAIILSTAAAERADALVTGGARQYENEWKEVTEMRVSTLSDFMEKL